MTISARDRSRGGSGDSGPAHAPAIGGSPRNVIPFNRSNPSPLETGANTGLPLERSKINQTALDIIAVFGIAVFILLSAASYVVSFYIVFFVGVK